jgi:hypothetical protein
MAKEPPFSILKAVCTLRKESDLSFEVALDKAIKFFQARDWRIPESILTMYDRRKPKCPSK